MSLISTLARLEAVESGRAQPLATVCHRRLSDRPLVFVPLTTAGEAGAPLGALVGTDRGSPRLLTVAQPRDRDLRFAFLAELAETLLPHLDAYADDVEPAERSETDPETGKRVKVEVDLCVDAPQLIVPNRPGVDFVRLLGRSMRFRRTAEQDPDTPYPAPARVPLLGRWLTHYGERARVPGSSLLLAATDLLNRHWATGQSNLEDQHLGALLAWLDPPDGGSGRDAALRAETDRDGRGQLRCPPAGPATDPAFDNRLLAPAIDEYDRARQFLGAAEDGPGADEQLGRLDEGRAGDPRAPGEPVAADVGRGVAGARSAAGAAGGGAGRRPVDARPLVVHGPPGPGAVRGAAAAPARRRGDGRAEAGLTGDGAAAVGGAGGAGRPAGAGGAAGWRARRSSGR